MRLIERIGLANCRYDISAMAVLRPRPGIMTTSTLSESETDASERAPFV